MSRKRFRPLDAAEAHSVHPEQLLYVGLLDSERSYRFSWPEAPLTLLLAQRDALVEADTALPALHPLTHHTRQQREDGHMGAPRVPLPPVYDMCAMSSNTLASSSAAITPTKSSAMSYIDDIDVARLVQPFREQLKAHDCLVPMPQDVPPYKAHPLAPDKTHRGGSTEDSVFSFTEAQWQEVQQSGLLDRIVSTTTQSIVTSDGVKAEMDNKAAIAAARRAAEQEVVGLEWQAFRESKRTAAALQRLLTLDAAVPFTPCTAALTPSPSQELLVQQTAASSGNGGAEAQQHQASVNEWRYMLHQMWLRWRRPTTPHGASEEDTASLPPQAHQPPWGAPLLAGAFLYGMQPDYFLDTEVIDSGVAATGRATRVPMGGKGREFATASSADTPLLARASETGERASRSVLLRTAPLPRRRGGAYGFLRWRLDRHSAAYSAADVVVVDDSNSTSGTSYGEADATSHSATINNHSSIGGGGSIGHGVLGAERVEAMFMQDILTRPLTSLELVDDAEDAEAAWHSLARYDLKRETEAWQSWLSKM